MPSTSATLVWIGLVLFFEVVLGHFFELFVPRIVLLFLTLFTVIIINKLSPLNTSSKYFHFKGVTVVPRNPSFVQSKLSGIENLSSWLYI